MEWTAFANCSILFLYSRAATVFLCNFWVAPGDGVNDLALMYETPDWVRNRMARSDLLVSLVRAAVAGDKETTKSTAEALAADERAKKHHVLADRLERALSAVTITPPPLTTSAAVAQTGKEAIIEIEPKVRFDELILTLPVRETAKQLVEEHVRADVLRAHGYEPRHRVLLSGPPGNGKTSFAEGIAEAVALPLFVVRYDALIGSYLGETNARLRRLFDYVRTRPCVLFFDEFDAIGKERGDTHETGEIKRVVSFLLMQLDQLPSYVIVITATNHAELLDRAVWRRFQIRLQFPAPDRSQVEQYVQRVMDGWPITPSVSAKKCASALGNVSYAEALDFCQNVRRRHILTLGDLDIDAAIKTELGLWASRVGPGSVDAQRSDEAAPSTDPARRAGPRAGKARQRRQSPTV